MNTNTDPYYEDKDEGHPNPDHVCFSTWVHNMRPANLARLAEESGEQHAATSLKAKIEAAERQALMLRRYLPLPGVPRVGDQVCHHPSWTPATVEAVHWILDPDPDEGETHVEVVLSNVDLDEVGEEWGALEMLLDIGWSPLLYTVLA